MSEGLRLEVDSPTATIWIDRAEKRNALTAAMWATLPGVVEQAAADRSVRVLVVRGVGEHFCAGADIAELGEALAADTGAVAYRALNARAEEALSSAPLPTVAAIDGSCVGGGVQIALACDLRIATSRARLGITAGRLGITFPAPSLERLVSTVGASCARRLLLTSELLGADDALRLGLVDEVVDPQGLDDALAATVGALATTSSVTQLAAKEMVAAITRTGAVPASLARAWEATAASAGDLREGLEAFAERRAPSFGPRATRPDG